MFARNVKLGSCKCFEFIQMSQEDKNVDSGFGSTSNELDGAAVAETSQNALMEGVPDLEYLFSF